MKLNFKMLGYEKIERDLKKLAKLPQTAVTKSAKAGANVAFKYAKQKVPVDTGDMRKGLVLKPEKRSKLGKKVYFISYKKSMNDTFVKIYGDNKRAYYPASQEWGFTVMGHYTPGYRTLRKAIDTNKSEITKSVLETFGKEIDKALK